MATLGPGGILDSMWTNSMMRNQINQRKTPLNAPGQMAGGAPPPPAPTGMSPFDMLKTNGATSTAVKASLGQPSAIDQPITANGVMGSGNGRDDVTTMTRAALAIRNKRNSQTNERRPSMLAGASRFLGTQGLI